jgi:methionyl-tRNA formyltransferase
MKLAFFGSPDFALSSFQKLLADKRFEIVLTATQSDKPSGRGLKLKPTAVKQAALDANIPVFENIPSEADLRNAGVEKIAVVAYGRLIPAEIVNNWECVNLHPSLLPKYRGASPMQSVLLNGETETAVTTMLINEKMDAGDILLQEKFFIDENLSLAELETLCAERGAELLIQTLQTDIQKIRRPQDDSKATYCSKLGSADMLMRPGDTALQIHNRVRAVGVCLVHCGKKVKILKTRLIGEQLEVITIQPEGKAPMAYADFKNGYGEINL